MWKTLDEWRELWQTEARVFTYIALVSCSLGFTEYRIDIFCWDMITGYRPWFCTRQWGQTSVLANIETNPWFQTTKNSLSKHWDKSFIPNNEKQWKSKYRYFNGTVSITASVILLFLRHGQIYHLYNINLIWLLNFSLIVFKSVRINQVGYCIINLFCTTLETTPNLIHILFPFGPLFMC